MLDPASCTLSHLLWDEHSREAVLIDPVDDQLARDLALLRDLGLRLVWTVETHAHADHITSAGWLAEHTGARTAAPVGCGIGSAAVQLVHGDALPFGGQRLLALHTPGHTAGSMSYLWSAPHAQHVFTGDTLLINGCGRTDFQSGSAEALYRSLTEVLFAPPDDTRVWPGHDYHGQSSSTIGHEKRHNVRIAGKTREAFVALMDGLHLPPPARLAEAVPANQLSGLRRVSRGVRHDADALLAAHPRPAAGYAGDVSPQLAWAWVAAGEAVLVDVRSDAEREWVGFVPGAVAVPWKQWPGMQLNPDFDAAIRSAGADGRKLVLLCRSGVRSVAAARRAAELGLCAYNILEGFEGDPDIHAHRGQAGGWRFHGLPWRQH